MFPLFVCLIFKKKRYYEEKRYKMDLEKIKEIIDTTEFEEQCRNELDRALKNAEKQVKVNPYLKREISVLDIIFLFLISLLISCFIIYFLMGSFKTFQNMDSSLFGFYLLAFSFIIFKIFIFFAGLYSGKKVEQNRIIKTFMLKKMLSLIGKFEYITYPPKKSGELAVSLMNSKIFKGITGFVRVDDHFRGKYKDILLRIYDIEVISKHSNKHLVYLRMPCKKRFNGFTLIKEKYKDNYIGEKVNLEDIDFQKNFSVRSSNQIEARYLVTTSLMERLLKNKSYLIPEILFEGSEIHILIETYIDFFNISITDLYTNTNLIKTPIFDLIKILEIVDELKLNQNIGL